MPSTLQQGDPFQVSPDHPLPRTPHVLGEMDSAVGVGVTPGTANSGDAAARHFQTGILGLLEMFSPCKRLDPGVPVVAQR